MAFTNFVGHAPTRLISGLMSIFLSHLRLRGLQHLAKQNNVFWLQFYSNTQTWIWLQLAHFQGNMMLQLHFSSQSSFLKQPFFIYDSVSLLLCGFKQNNRAEWGSLYALLSFPAQLIHFKNLKWYTGLIKMYKEPWVWHMSSVYTFLCVLLALL